MIKAEMTRAHNFSAGPAVLPLKYTKKQLCSPEIQYSDVNNGVAIEQSFDNV
jgi:phosphoserine aminotransferase